MERTGRTSPLTVVSGVPRWWRFWLVRLNWPYANWRNEIGRPIAPVRKLTELSFLPFAHWSVFDRMPPGSKRSGWLRRRQGRKLAHPYLLFEANFNRGFQEYIEAFSYVVPFAIWELWGAAYGVPNPKPTAPFQRYILDHAARVPHYYCAYTEASTRMVSAALDLEGRVQRFNERTEGLGPKQFADEWRRFLVEIQWLI